MTDPDDELARKAVGVVPDDMWLRLDVLKNHVAAAIRQARREGELAMRERVVVHIKRVRSNMKHPPSILEDLETTTASIELETPKGDE